MVSLLPQDLLETAPPFLPVQAPTGWHAVLFPCGRFPSNALERDAIGHFTETALQTIAQTRKLQHYVVLQVWKLGPGTGAEILDENIGKWSPSLGLGIWPDRDPPRAWTNEDVSDAAAAMFREDEVPLRSHKLMTLGTRPPETMEAARRMRGFGALLQILASSSMSGLQSSCRDLYLPRIEAKRFRLARFFLPILDCASLAAASTPAELDQWLGGADVYLRESPEDNGVLLLSRWPVLPAPDVPSPL